MEEFCKCGEISGTQTNQKEKDFGNTGPNWGAWKTFEMDTGEKFGKIVKKEKDKVNL